jgi:hypothetical protein
VKRVLGVDGGSTLVWKTDWNTRCWRSLHCDATAAGMLGLQAAQSLDRVGELPALGACRCKLLASRGRHQLPRSCQPRSTNSNQPLSTLPRRRAGKTGLPNLAAWPVAVGLADTETTAGPRGNRPSKPIHLSPWRQGRAAGTAALDGDLRQPLTARGGERGGWVCRGLWSWSLVVACGRLRSRVTNSSLESCVVACGATQWCRFRHQELIIQNPRLRDSAGQAGMACRREDRVAQGWLGRSSELSQASLGSCESFGSSLLT